MGQCTCRVNCDCCCDQCKHCCCCDGNAHKIDSQLPLSVHKVKTARTKEENLPDVMPAWHDLESAVPQYMAYIESHLKVDYDIEGLGHYNQIEGYYEWYINDWYQDCVQQGVYTPNPYDILALGFAACKDEATRDRGLAWYRRMKRKNSRYQILVGYAHLLYLKRQYQKALRVYKKVADLNPEWQLPYECVALIYEYDLQRADKSTEMALTILEMNSDNMWAMLVMARNRKTYKQRFQHYQNLTKLYPFYPRAMKEYGVVYSEKKLIDQSIGCFEHCIKLAEPYAECYSNTGYCHELKGDPKTAMEWYMQAIRRDPENYQFHSNLVVAFNKLEMTDQAIIETYKSYLDVDPFLFCYKLGVAYYDKQLYQSSLNWFDRALQIPHKDHYKVYNALGVSYDFLQEHATAQQSFLQCIKLEPSTQSAYQNLAISYKAQWYIDKTIEFHTKGIEVDPVNSQAYNSLATLFQEQGHYEKALHCYRQACYHHPRDTIAHASYGYCLLKCFMYQEGFREINRARLSLPFDENIPEQSLDFLREVFRKTREEEDEIGKEGIVHENHRQNIVGLINTFQDSVKPLQLEEGLENIPMQRALRRLIIEIICEAYKDKFSLSHFSRLTGWVWQLHQLNEQYFHIVPQLIIEHYWTEKISNRMSIAAIEESIGQKISTFLRLEGRTIQQPSPYFEEISLRYFRNDQFRSVNLFETVLYFSDYDQLTAQIKKVNEEAKKMYPCFLTLTAQIREQSEGAPVEEGMKIPNNENQQFEVMMTLMSAIFKDELTPRKLESLRGKIEAGLKKTEKSSSDEVLFMIAKTWMLTVGEMLEERREHYIPTHFTAADLMWSHIQYETVDDLLDAMEITEEIIINKHYKVVDLNVNRKNGLEVTFNVDVQGMVGQITLRLKQDHRKQQFIHALAELRDSTLGIVFGSYISMGRPIHYPLLDNCRDIMELLRDKHQALDRRTKEACRFVARELTVTQSEE